MTADQDESASSGVAARGQTAASPAVFGSPMPPSVVLFVVLDAGLKGENVRGD